MCSGIADTTRNIKYYVPINSRITSLFVILWECNFNVYYILINNIKIHALLPCISVGNSYPLCSVMNNYITPLNGILYQTTIRYISFLTLICILRVNLKCVLTTNSILL